MLQHWIPSSVWQNCDQLPGPNTGGSRPTFSPREKDWADSGTPIKQEFQPQGPLLAYESPLWDTERLPVLILHRCKLAKESWCEQRVSMTTKPHFPPMKSKHGPKPKLSHHRDSVLGSLPFLTWTMPLRAPLVSLCLCFLPCACAVTMPPHRFPGRADDDVCKVFLFPRMRRAITGESKRHWRTFLSCNHLPFELESHRGIKGVSLLVDCCSGGPRPPPDRNPRERGLSRLLT